MDIYIYIFEGHSKMMFPSIPFTDLYKKCMNQIWLYINMVI